jgi:hypothetical protein
MCPIESIQPRMSNGITILGPDILAKDPAGRPLSPIGAIFPDESVLVTGHGIHADLIARGIEFLRSRLNQTEKRDLTAEEEQEFYGNAVSMLTRESTVLIRSYPEDMDRVFAADQILQRLLPKECIQFTGIHIRRVRERMRRRGESWRISAPPASIHEISQHISSSRVQVNTGTTYYQNAQTGERFLTYEEFLRILPLLRTAPQVALARLKEINQLSHLVNDLGVPELSFFLPAQRKLRTKLLEDLIATLETSTSPKDLDRAEDLFHYFALSYAEAAGEELVVDGEKHTTWQTTMFCRLYDLNEEVVEELALGLSAEFHLNVRWLPGAQLSEKDITFESTSEPRVRNLINHFLQEWPGIVSINVGRVESPLTTRDRTGEERQVYLVVLGLPDGVEEIRLLRMMKWDVVHRLKQGFSLAQAIADTVTYYDYICDRLNAITALEIPILSYTPIRFTEEITGSGEIPVFFFDRRYVPGIVTDKIRLTHYARKGFVTRLARLLGIAAAASMVSGRASYRTGEIFFDDGDEVVQLDAEGLPERLVICETTGSFTDWTTPIVELLPQCLVRLAAHLEKGRGKGISRENLKSAVEAFTEALMAEIERMQSLLNSRSAALRSLFDARSAEPRSVRARWDSILDRLAAADITEIQHTALNSPYLADFMNP